MKFLIAIDMEGCACVNGEPYKTLTDSRDYQFACRQATAEAAAAARGLLSRGAKEVIVWDNHGSSLNLNYDLLPEECLILGGVGKRERMAFLGDIGNASNSGDIICDGAILLGYHAEGNTQNAVLAHTYSSVAYQYIKVNGVITGEIGIDAMMLGEKGVPVMMVSGDDKACAEAKTFLPFAELVETKKAYGYNISLSKHPKAVEKEIFDASVKAIDRLPEMSPLQYERPVALEIRFKRIDAASEAERMGFQRIDAYTCVKELKKLSDYFRS